MNFQKITYYKNEEGFVFNTQPLIENDDYIIKKKTEDGYKIIYTAEPCWGLYDFNPDPDFVFLVFYHKDCLIDCDRVTREQVRDMYIKNDFTFTGYKVYPVAGYIHSTVTLNIGNGDNFPDSRWDVSRCGAVFVSKKQCKPKERRKVAGNHVEYANRLLNGDVYDIVVNYYDHEKKLVNEEITDTIWGYENLVKYFKQLKKEI